MEVAGHRVSRVDNTWGFYRSTLSPKEKTPKDHFWYDKSLCFFLWCDTNT